MKPFLIFLILLISLYVCGKPAIGKVGYDSTYVLAIKQKFAIPEQVYNGDYVGVWRKTYTWRSGNEIRFSLERNYKSAFSINQTTGLISISNAAKIHGKITMRDTIINLIIRTTDSVLGFEDDTCEIHVKGKKFSVFIDNTFKGKQLGSRSNPFAYFPNTAIKAGYGYFIKRGNTFYNEVYDIIPFKASRLHPTILAAYFSGNNPIFDGSELTSGEEAFNFKNIPFPSEYCNIYNIDVYNYPSMAFRIRTRSKSFGLYNCNFKNNVRNTITKGLADVYYFGDAADTLINWHHELINLESTGSWGPIVKTDASGLLAYNIKSATANIGFNFRFAISYYSRLSHFLFMGGGRSLQVRYPYVKITDGIITGSAEAGMFLVTDDYYKGKPDFLEISNILFRDNDYGILSYNKDINNTKIENCYFDSNKNDGVYFKNGGIGRTIRYCTFINNKKDGIQLDYNSQGSTNLLILQNLFVGNKGKSINASNRYCAENLKIYNNTIIGVIDLSGAVNSSVANNFYLFTWGNFTSSNNFVLDSTSIFQIFRDPKNYDYRLKPTAIMTVKKGIKAERSAIATKEKEVVIGAFEYE